LRKKEKKRQGPVAMPEKDTEQMLAQVFVCPHCSAEVFIMSLKQLRQVGVNCNIVEPPDEDGETGKDRLN
jgi:transcription elongation factor Elf1